MPSMLQATPECTPPGSPRQEAVRKDARRAEAAGGGAGEDSGWADVARVVERECSDVKLLLLHTREQAEERMQRLVSEMLLICLSHICIMHIMAFAYLYIGWRTCWGALRWILLRLSQRNDQHHLLVLHHTHARTLASQSTQTGPAVCRTVATAGPLTTRTTLLLWVVRRSRAWVCRHLEGSETRTGRSMRCLRPCLSPGSRRRFRPCHRQDGVVPRLSKSVHPPAKISRQSGGGT